MTVGVSNCLENNDLQICNRNYLGTKTRRKEEQTMDGLII